MAHGLRAHTRVGARLIGFDEWIHNVDRNLQNLLWDGFDDFVLIDHGLDLLLRPHRI